MTTFSSILNEEIKLSVAPLCINNYLIMIVRKTRPFFGKTKNVLFYILFSSPGRSLGRAIVLAPASVLALASTAASALAKC